MHPILCFPDLEGMTYPDLDRLNLRRTALTPDAAQVLPPEDRAAIRVLMTSASRGCSAALIAALPALELVVSQGAGQEKIAIDALAARGIRLRSVGEAVTDDVADLAMTMTHILLRDLVRADRFARSGDWTSGRFAVTESAVDKVIGIAGLSGRIGRAIAARARVSRMRIAGLDRPSNFGLGDDLYPDITALAKASDILVLALPASPGLTHLVNAEVLAALGPTGILVNVARGALVDTAALLAALESGDLGAAGLDVLEEEPRVPPRLAALPNVLVTPHIGAQTWGQRARSAAIAETEILVHLRHAWQAQG